MRQPADCNGPERFSPGAGVQWFSGCNGTDTKEVDLLPQFIYRRPVGYSMTFSPKLFFLWKRN